MMTDAEKRELNNLLFRLEDASEGLFSEPLTPEDFREASKVQKEAREKVVGFVDALLKEKGTA